MYLLGDLLNISGLPSLSFPLVASANLALTRSSFDGVFLTSSLSFFSFTSFQSFFGDLTGDRSDSGFSSCSSMGMDLASFTSFLEGFFSTTSGDSGKSEINGGGGAVISSTCGNWRKSTSSLPNRL